MNGKKERERIENCKKPMIDWGRKRREKKQQNQLRPLNIYELLSHSIQDIIRLIWMQYVILFDWTIL